MKNFLLLIAFSLGGYLFSQLASSAIISFKYDDSGNQIERKYSTLSIGFPKQAEEDVSLSLQFEEMLKIYPNPTRGLFSIEWEKEFSQYISQVEVLSVDALLQRNPVNYLINKLDIDLTTKQSGIYFVRFHFTDGSTVSKKVIKL